MFALIIDTSTEQGCAAFADHHEILFQGIFPYGLNSSKHLLPEIERGFKFLKKKPEELNYIAVGIGPGSYTGIRMGVISAKTLAFALNKPLVTFCSLEAFIPSQKGSYAAIMDAKIGGVYLLKDSDKQPQMISLEHLKEAIKAVNILVTPNMKMIKPKVESLNPEKQWVWEERAPDALHLARLTYEKFSKGEFSDGKHLELLYLRKTQAEIEREQSSKIKDS